jgi:ATP-binding cassette subfamily C protein
LNVRRRGGIAVVIAHRPKALDGVEHVLVIAEGTVQSFGRKEDVLAKVLRTPAPLKVVAERQGVMRWTAR